MSNVKYISNEITEIKPGELINLPNPKNLKPRYVVSLSLEFYGAPAKYLVTIDGDTGNIVPADDYAPIKYGRWIEDNDYVIICSECKEPALQRLNVHLKLNTFDSSFVLSNFCPHCGVRMKHR